VRRDDTSGLSDIFSWTTSDSADRPYPGPGTFDPGSAMRQPNLVRWSCDCLRSWLARSRSTSAPVFDPPRAHQNFGRGRGSRRRAAARRRSLTHRLERPAHTVAARGTGRVLGSRDRCWAGTGNSARHRRPVDGMQQSRRPARRHPAPCCVQHGLTVVKMAIGQCLISPVTQHGAATSAEHFPGRLQAMSPAGNAN
jgi:hypothetical protein